VCTARARVACDLRSAGGDRLARDQSAERDAATRANRLAWRANACGTPRTHRVLDQPVLAGVICDDGEGAARYKHVTQYGKDALESAQLLVHRDAHRLKEASEVAWAGRRTKSAANGADQIIGNDEVTRRASPDDLVREPASTRLIAVFAEYPRQIVYSCCVEQVRRGFAYPGHSHVQRNAWPEREASFVAIYLRR